MSTLLLIRFAEDSSPEARRLADWWSIQPPQSSHRPPSAHDRESPANSSGAVLVMRGRRLEDETFTQAKQDSLKRFFHAMLDLVDRGLSVQMYPDFNPSLTWLATTKRLYAPCYPWRAQFQPRWIRSVFVAKAFYRFATGIELGQQPASANLPFSAGRSSVARNCLGSSTDAFRQSIPRSA